MLTSFLGYPVFGVFDIASKIPLKTLAVNAWVWTGKDAGY
jgi:hypothetical protein